MGFNLKRNPIQAFLELTQSTLDINKIKKKSLCKHDNVFVTRLPTATWAKLTYILPTDIGPNIVVAIRGPCGYISQFLSRVQLASLLFHIANTH